MSLKAAVRYYSRGGHVKQMAEALARGAGVEAISIDDPRAPLKEPVDVLFIGGGLYYYQLDSKLRDYIENLDADMVPGRAVCFGSSYLTRRPVYLIQDYVKRQGITVAPQALYARNNPRQLILDAAEYFAECEINRDPELDGLAPYQYWTRAEEKRKKAEEEAAAAAAKEGDVDSDLDASETVEGEE
jgi:flavodoxin